VEGPLTLNQIVQKTELEAGQVKESLVCLIQHNIMYFSVSEEQSHYHLLLNNIFVRVRFPRFCGIAKELFPVAGIIILRELFTNGRMTRTQLVAKVKDHRGRGGFSVVDDDAKIQAEIDELIKGQFLRLASAELRDAIEREVSGKKEQSTSRLTVESHRPVSAPSVGARGRGRGRGRGAAAAPKRLRPDDDEGNEKKKAKTKSKSDDVVEAAETCIPTLDYEYTNQSEALWFINPIPFEDVIRREKCTTLLETKFEHAAALVVSEMWDMVSALRGQKWVDRVIPEEKIAQKILALPTQPPFTPDLLQRVFLVITEGRIAKCVSSRGDNKYSLDVPEMMRMLRQREVESIIYNRYELQGLRIFRLLVMKTALEEQQVAKMTMISPTETRAKLTEMLRGDVIQVREIPKTKQDYKPQNVLFFWSVNWPNLVTLLTDQIYQAINNVNVKLHHELESHAGILQRYDAELRAVKSGAQASVNMLREHEEKAKMLLDIQDRMEDAILALDDTLFILSDNVDQDSNFISK